MTLEKLLIFGFALAVMLAITVTATGIRDDDASRANGYRGKVSTLVEGAS